MTWKMECRASTVLKFANDTNLYTEVTKEEGGEQLQEDLDKCIPSGQRNG